MQLPGKMVCRIFGLLIFLEVFIMIMAMICSVPCWPMSPVLGWRVLGGVLAIVGLIFSIVMLIDCLKRPASKFYNPLTRNGEYDKLIWAGAIVASLWLYFLGTIVYFFVVKKAKPTNSK